MNELTGKGGRPRVGPQHPVRMAPAEWAYVEALAARLNLDRSRAVRVIVQEHMRSAALMAGKESPRADRESCTRP